MPKKSSTYGVKIPWAEALILAGSEEALTRGLARRSVYAWKKDGVPSHAVARFLVAQPGVADKGMGEEQQRLPKTEADVLLERVLLRGIRLADREATAVLRAVETLLDQAEPISEEDLQAGGREELRRRLTRLLGMLDREQDQEGGG